MKKFILLLFVFSNSIIYSQVKNDVDNIFKMQLFLNKKNVNLKVKDTTIVKDNIYYNIFYNDVILKIDTLNNESRMPFNNPRFQFFKVNTNEIKHKNISNNKLLIDTGITRGMHDSFILAINKKTGISYRLAGFDTNDFFSFLSDFKEDYLYSKKEKFTTKKFLQNYKIRDVDFQCIYKGLKEDEINRIKYPCLRRCNDPIIIH